MPRPDLVPVAGHCALTLKGMFFRHRDALSFVLIYDNNNNRSETDHHHYSPLKLSVTPYNPPYNLIIIIIIIVIF